VDIPSLFSRSTGKSKISVLIVWLAASMLSSTAAGQAPSPPQFPEVVQRLMLECEQGKYESCSFLGMTYAYGSGVAKDEARAVAFYQRACDGGFAPGCYALGSKYASGTGVAKDEARAAALYQKACDGGSDAGCYALGFMYANGRGVPQSYDVAVDWYVLSAEQGDPTGQYLLGLMYDKGFGVTPNVILAHKWLNLAAAHAPRQVRENVLRLRDAVGSKMTRAQLDLAQQLAVDFVPVRQ